jgi:hypothetical protein
MSATQKRTFLKNGDSTSATSHSKSSPYKQRSLNLTTSSHVGWSISQALKEIIINSIDEHDECNLFLAGITIVYYENCLIIKDSGRGIKLENFCQGNSTKKSKDDLRGYHGQGLRGAISRLLFEGYDIHIKSPFLEGKFAVRDTIKILYRLPENEITGTEIQIFFRENCLQTLDISLSETIKSIIYFKESYKEKLEEIKCKDGTLVDVYMPNKYNEIHKGGFFYKGVKIGIGKTNTDFGLIYNIKHSKDLEGKIRGDANFNRILDVKDTYNIIKNTFKDPPYLNTETINFYETEIESKYTYGARITLKAGYPSSHKDSYKDLSRKPLWEIFVQGTVKGVNMNFLDDDHLTIIRRECNYENNTSKDNKTTSSPHPDNSNKSPEQIVTITKINYERSAVCEKAFDILRGEGFIIKYSD